MRCLQLFLLIGEHSMIPNKVTYLNPLLHSLYFKFECNENLCHELGCMHADMRMK